MEEPGRPHSPDAFLVGMGAEARLPRFLAALAALKKMRMERPNRQMGVDLPK
jgi:hypothetical protein